MAEKRYLCRELSFHRAFMSVPVRLDSNERGGSTLKEANMKKREILCPTVGVTGVCDLGNGPELCVVSNGTATLRRGRGIVHSVTLASLNGNRQKTFTDGEMPELRLCDGSGRSIVPLVKKPVEEVIFRLMRGRLTMSTDKPWSVTRFRMSDGKVEAMGFDLPQTVVFTKEGLSFEVEPDFGDYAFSTVAECVNWHDAKAA